MDQDVLMFVAVVAGVVLVTGHIMRLLRLRTLHATLREALRRDGRVPETLLDRLDDAPSEGGGDDRNGLILLALGLALIGYGWIAEEGANLRDLAAAALFPIAVGGVLLARGLYIRRRP